MEPVKYVDARLRLGDLAGIRFILVDQDIRKASLKEKKRKEKKRKEKKRKEKKRKESAHTITAANFRYEPPLSS